MDVELRKLEKEAVTDENAAVRYTDKCVQAGLVGNFEIHTKAVAYWQNTLDTLKERLGQKMIQGIISYLNLLKPFVKKIEFPEKNAESERFRPPPHKGLIIISPWIGEEFDYHGILHHLIVECPTQYPNLAKYDHLFFNILNITQTFCIFHYTLNLLQNYKFNHSVLNKLEINDFNLKKVVFTLPDTQVQVDLSFLNVPRDSEFTLEIPLKEFAGMEPLNNVLVKNG